MERNAFTSPIAIVGISTLLPGAKNVESYWDNILSGRDEVRDVPDSQWSVEDYYDPDPTRQSSIHCRRGAFIPKVPFDPVAFGMPPKILQAIDVQQLIALVVARAVIDETEGLGLGRIDRGRAAVIVGVSGAAQVLSQLVAKNMEPHFRRIFAGIGMESAQVDETCRRLMDTYMPWEENTFPGYLNNIVSGRIANRFNLKGTNCTVDAACASSAAAFNLAIAELRQHRQDIVYTGGVDATGGITGFFSFAKTHALSPSGDCRPFASDADGTILGEGGAMVALRRLEDAERDGDTIYAVLRDLGSSSDGRIKSIYAPSSDGQAEAIRNAYRGIEYGMQDVELIEAHGTGTVAGDRVEFDGLMKAWGRDGQERRAVCALGSVKSQIGHTKAAAGTAALIKMTLALQHRVVPPTIKVAQVNPRLKIDESPFYLPTRPRPWVHVPGSTRKAGISSFGFGGANYHFTVEEYAGSGIRPKRMRRSPLEVFLLSAPDVGGVLEALGRLTDSVATEGFVAAARASQLDFESTAMFRLAVLASDPATLAENVVYCAQRIGQDPGSSFSVHGRCFYASGERCGKVVFLFPGQGSQYLDMGCDLAMEFAEAQAVWDETLVHVDGEVPLHRVVFPVPAFDAACEASQAERLVRTEWAQPAIGAHSAALLAVLRKAGVHADFTNGHSFGELTALYAAGSLDLPSFLGAARERGRLMRDAAEGSSSTMTAVAASTEWIEPVLREHGLDLVCANQNSPKQTVVAGAVSDIEGFENILESLRVSYRRLSVAAAFHSPAVASAVAPFGVHLDATDFRSSNLQAWSNCTASPFPDNAERTRQILASQIAMPVRFSETVENLHAVGARVFVEVGPGGSLSRLVSDILGDRPHRAVVLDRKGQNGVLGFWQGLAELSVSGVRVDYAALWSDVRIPAIEPGVSPATIMIDGSMLQKPKPLPELPRLQHAALDVSPVAIPIASIRDYGNSRQIPSESEFAAVCDSPIPVAGEQEVPTSGSSRSWLLAQERIASAQERFEKTMLESHMAYLRTAQEALRALGGHTSSVSEPVRKPAPTDVEAIEVPGSNPSGGDQTTEFVLPAIAAKPSGRQAFVGLLKEVVSDKTGYPQEMLADDLDLEAGLGIDSIKKIEIFSALMEKIPGFPEDELASLSGLETIATIADRLAAIMQRMESAPISVAAGSASGGSTRRLVPGAVGANSDRIRPVAISVAGVLEVVGGPESIAMEIVGALERASIPARRATDPSPESRACVFLQLEAGHSVEDDAWRACAVARKVGQNLRSRPGIFVTVQKGSGRFGFDGNCQGDPWRSGLSGLAKCCAKEWNEAHVKAIEIDTNGVSEEWVARSIVDEIIGGGPDLEVGITARGERIRIELVESQLHASGLALGFRGDGPILVSGGGRGIAASSLLALAKKRQFRLVLLGRSQLIEESTEIALAVSESELTRKFFDGASPLEAKRKSREILASREIRATLDALRQLGTDAEYVSIDVRDGNAVRTVVDDLRSRHGAISGVIHAAGVLADQLVHQKTRETFDAVWRTKVDGFRNLLEATAVDDLSLIVCFSSAAARFGNQGQSDYAMANEVLNKVCARESARRGSDCVVRSINWGPWDGGMVSEFLKKQFKAAGVDVIGTESGSEFFVQELSHRDSVVEVVCLGDGNGRV